MLPINSKIMTTMKSIKYLMMAAISCCLTTACMNDNDSFDIPDTVEGNH